MMDNEPKLKVEIMEDARALVVSLPGTNYQITAWPDGTARS